MHVFNHHRVPWLSGSEQVHCHRKGNPVHSPNQRFAAMREQALVDMPKFQWLDNFPFWTVPSFDGPFEQVGAGVAVRKLRVHEIAPQKSLENPVRPSLCERQNCWVLDDMDHMLPGTVPAWVRHRPKKIRQQSLKTCATRQTPKLSSRTDLRPQFFAIYMRRFSDIAVGSLLLRTVAYFEFHEWERFFLEECFAMLCLWRSWTKRQRSVTESAISTGLR